MEPLVTNRQCLIWLRICPVDDSTSRWQKLAHTAFSVTVLTGIICMMAACLTFCWQFVLIDFGRSVFSFMVAVAEFIVIYMALVGMILLRHKIGAIFDNLSAIYKDNENTDSFRHLAHANSTSERMWGILFKIMAVAVIMNIIAAPLISISFSWSKNRHLNVENLYHPVPYVLPWNQTTPMGYAGEVIFSAPGTFGFWFVNSTFLLLFVSICQHHQAFFRMFKHSVDKLDGENQCDAQFLCILMGFHISVKNWFIHTADVYSSFNAIQLIINEIMVAMSIFYLDFQFQHHSINVTNALTTFLASISNLFIYCYLGKVAAESHAKMSDCVYNEMKWYEVPTGLQKYFILMIQNMQQPLYYHGFGVILLNLETFIKLIKSAISFYALIKAMT